MGSEVIAYCKCGLKANILIGGGRVNFLTTCYFPCLCVRCSNVVQANLLTKTLRCPKCRSTKLTPYDNTDLAGSPGQDEVAEWNVEDKLGRTLKLTNGTYKCPKCEKFTLRFKDSGLRSD